MRSGRFLTMGTAFPRVPPRNDHWATSVFISELLCFYLNKYGKTHLKNIKEVIISFYDADEILKAKELLHSELSNVHTEGLPRLSRRQGDNRSLRDVDDITTYITIADEAGTLSSLPVFVAADLSRVPSLNMEDLDITVLAKKLSMIEAKVSRHDELLREASKTNLYPVSSPMMTDANDQPVQPSTQSTVHVEPSELLSQSIDREEEKENTTTDKLDFVTVVRKQPKPRPVPTVPAVRVHGTKVMSSTSNPVRTVPRKKVLAAFVGRLHIDTTEKQLTEFLLNEGMKGVVCKKLKSKEGQTFTTAAFYVTCATESDNLFYNENCWPAGVELRDWVYKQTR